MKYTGRTSVRNQLSCCRPPGFEGVVVALHGAFCMEILKIIYFVGGEGGPIDYVTEISNLLGNFLIMENLMLFQSKFPTQNISIFRKQRF